jgi:hypothetical protein
MEEIRFDPDALTLGDLEDFQEATGKELLPFFARFADKKVTVAELFAELNSKSLTAMIWIFKRKEHPAFTLAQARALPLASLAPPNGQARPKAKRKTKPK